VVIALCAPVGLCFLSLHRAPLYACTTSPFSLTNCHYICMPQLTLPAPCFRCWSRVEMRKKTSCSPWSTRYSSLSMSCSFSLSKEANVVAAASAICLSSYWDTREMMQQFAHPNGRGLTRSLEVLEMTTWLSMLPTESREHFLNILQYKLSTVL
jgi:hypothetical protein